MALKFLNKKGWHTGSLRNIENVWKAEQKHEAEQRKLEELRKQIQDERERTEFRQLQEQAGLVPRQERLDFLYESGLAVGKSSEGSGFKALEGPPTGSASVAAPGASSGGVAGSSKAAVPGALFEDKPQTANDTWRKLHSDPLFLIRQREQDALNRIKNNPIQMAMIKKSVEAEKNSKKEKKEKHKKKHKQKHHDNDLKEDKRSSEVHSDQEETDEAYRRKRDRSVSEHHHIDRSRKDAKRSSRSRADSERGHDDRRKRDHSTSERHHYNRNLERHSSRAPRDSSDSSDSEKERSRNNDRKYEHRQRHYSRTERRSSRADSDSEHKSQHEEERKRSHHSESHRYNSDSRHLRDVESSSKHADDRSHRPTSEIHREDQKPNYGYNHRRSAPKLSEEEREKRLREMQLNAELHEEQRWKRLKRAAEDDAREAVQSSSSAKGKNFLDDAQKSIFGTEKGGSSTIEESVRRRAYYSQGGTAATERNAFRR